MKAKKKSKKVLVVKVGSNERPAGKEDIEAVQIGLAQISCNEDLS